MIARALKDKWKDQPNIGIMLPPSVGGVLANLAAMFACRTIVNLNFTSGDAAVASAIQQAEIKTVISSRLFMTKVKIDLPPSIQLIFR